MIDCDYYNAADDLNEVENHDPPGRAEGVVEEIDDKHSDLVLDHKGSVSEWFF